MEIGEHFLGVEAGDVSVAPGALNVSRYEAGDWRKVPLHWCFIRSDKGLSLPMPSFSAQTGKIEWKTCVCSHAFAGFFFLSLNRETVRDIVFGMETHLPSITWTSTSVGGAAPGSQR